MLAALRNEHTPVPELAQGLGLNHEVKRGKVPCFEPLCEALPERRVILGDVRWPLGNDEPFVARAIELRPKGASPID
jgi:hypothetical protein